MTFHEFIEIYHAIEKNDISSLRHLFNEFDPAQQQLYFEKLEEVQKLFDDAKEKFSYVRIDEHSTENDIEGALQKIRREWQ